MKNIFNAVVITFAFILMFSCSSEKPEQSRKIVFWNFWSEPYQKAALDKLIDTFEVRYNCTVETSQLSWGDGKTKLFAAFNSRTAPDVLELGSDWVAQFSASGVLAEMNPDTMDIKKYIEFSHEPAYWQNKLYAIPWTVGTRAMFFNKDLMEKAGLEPKCPETFEEMLLYAEEINNIEDVYGYGANGDDEHRLYKKILIFMWSNGGELFEADTSNLSSTQNVEALMKYIELSGHGIIETQRQIDGLFAQGKVGMWISGSWLVKKIMDINPDLNFDVGLVPSINGHPGISFAGGEYLAISKQSENKELAREFIKFITEGHNTLEFLKEIGLQHPADKDFYDDEYYQNQPYRSAFARQLEQSKMTPVHPKWLDIESAIENAAVEALYGRKGPDEALEEADVIIENIIRNTK